MVDEMKRSAMFAVTKQVPYKLEVQAIQTVTRTMGHFIFRASCDDQAYFYLVSLKGWDEETHIYTWEIHDLLLQSHNVVTSV